MNENGKFSSPDNSLTTSLLFIFAWPIVSIMVTFMLYIYEPFIEKRIDYLVEKWKTHKKRGSDLADELGLGLDDNTDDMGPL